MTRWDPPGAGLPTSSRAHGFPGHSGSIDAFIEPCERARSRSAP